MSVKLLRLPQVCEKIGLAKSTIWMMAANGKFPKQVKLSKRISVWKESDIEEWIEQKILESK